MLRLSNLLAELEGRFLERFDRRGGVGLRRGGRGRGGQRKPGPTIDPNALYNDQGELLTNAQGEVVTSG